MNDYIHSHRSYCMKSRRIAFAMLMTFGLSFNSMRLLADEKRATAVDLPDFGIAKIVEGGRVEVDRLIEYREVRTIKTPLPDGVAIKAGAGTTVAPASRTVMASSIVSQTFYLELKDAKGRRVNGDPVSPKVLAKELEHSAPVIILEQDGAIAQPIAKLFAPGALVLVLPPPEAPTLIVPPPQQGR